MKKKPLSTGKKLLVILFFSISIIFLGILLGFFIKYLHLGITMQDKYTLDQSLIVLVFSSIIGIIFFITLIVLLRDYDRNKKEKNKKWYIDKILLALTPVWITIATVIFSFYEDEKEVVYLFYSIIIFLIIGISTTPNVILYALNDMKNWENIFYKKGNLHKHKRAEGFYMMRTPVPFEKKLYLAVIKEQLLNISTIVLCIMFFIIIALLNGAYEGNVTPGNIVHAVMHTRSTRAEGYFFFGAVFLAAFWIPIFAYYITNAVYKLRIVRRHEYIVYHAIVDKVDTFKIRINNSGVHYAYDYCDCVGIKAKNINKTRAILIFIPDDLLLFPDNEKYLTKKKINHQIQINGKTKKK